MDPPKAKKSYGAEWTLYIDTIIARHVFLMLVKYGDRVEGVFTRPGMLLLNDSNVQKIKKKRANYGEYLEGTQSIFSSMKPDTDLEEEPKPYYADSPLNDELKSLRGCLGVGHRIGGMFLQFTKAYYEQGSRGIGIEYAYEEWKKSGTSKLELSSFFREQLDFGALKFYEELTLDQKKCHPFVLFIDQIRNVEPPEGYEEHYEMVVEFLLGAILEHCPDMAPMFTSNDAAFSHNTLEEQPAPMA